MIKAAVIGTGYMGQKHAQIYAKLAAVKLCGVADRRMDVAAKTRDKFGGLAYANHLDLIAEQNPHVVSIATPTASHCDIAIDIIKAGIHVLVEKPMAMTVTQAQKMIDAAQAAQVCLMIGHIERFNPVIHRLKNLLLHDLFRPIIQIEAKRHGPYPMGRVMDTNIIMDLAIHDLDLMRYLSDSEADRVYAESRDPQNLGRNYNNHDSFAGVIKFKNGIIGSLSASWGVKYQARQITVICDQAMLAADLLTNSITVTKMGDTTESKQFEIAGSNALENEIKAFLIAVSGAGSPVVSGADGLESLRLAISMQAGQVVPMGAN